VAAGAKRRLYKIARITVSVAGAAVVALTLTIIAILVFVKPPGGPFDPAAWRPAPGFTIDPAKVDQETARSIRPFTQTEFKGPEDVAVDRHGNVYTGTSDGKIMRISQGQQTAEVFADVAGRPLGLAFDRAGSLIVANQGVGLQSVAPNGEVTLLTDTADGAPIHFANDLAIGGNGIIYFSDSNQKYNPASLGDLPSFSLYDFLEGIPRGRLLQYDPATKETKMLADGLYFPNGVVVTSDQQSVLVAESTRYRISRYWLDGEKAGTTEVFLDDIPGILDGFTRTSDGRLLLPMYDRSAALDRLILPYAWTRQLLVRMPWLAGVSGDPAGSVLILSESGAVLRQITDIKPSPANITPYGNEWLLGTLQDGRLRLMPSIP
jgi:sugar lactone lactonase YvrE